LTGDDELLGESSGRKCFLENPRSVCCFKGVAIKAAYMVDVVFPFLEVPDENFF